MGKILVWVAGPEVFRALQAAQMAAEIDRAMGWTEVDAFYPQCSEFFDDWEKAFKASMKIEISQNKQNGYRSYSKPEKSWKYQRPWAKRQWQRRRR